MTNHVNAIRAKLLVKGIPCTIHVVIPYVTSVALERLQHIEADDRVSVQVHFDTVIPTIKEQLPTEDFAVLDEFCTNMACVELSNPSNPNNDSGITGVYFDHKIPNKQSFILSAIARETMPQISTPYTN